MVDMVSSDPATAASARSSVEGSDPSGMVERVARALFEKHRNDKLRLIREGTVSASMSGIEYYDGGWEGQDESSREYLRSEASAVIEAMREPTEDMLDNGQASLDYTPIKHCETQAHKVWSAMIDAALTEDASEPATAT